MPDPTSTPSGPSLLGESYMCQFACGRISPVWPAESEGLFVFQDDSSAAFRRHSSRPTLLVSSCPVAVLQSDMQYVLSSEFEWVHVKLLCRFIHREFSEKCLRFSKSPKGAHRNLVRVGHDAVNIHVWYIVSAGDQAD